MREVDSSGMDSGLSGVNGTRALMELKGTACCACWVWVERPGEKRD